MRSTRRIQVIDHGNNLRLRTTGDWEGEPLEALRQSGRLATAVDKLTRESVHRARDAGHSWTQIGEALCITKQAAWERFSGEE
jgi:hypothetical protein